MHYAELPNGRRMPVIGFGTYRIDPKDTREAVSQALSMGYRSIDTAQLYRNEREVGQAVAASGIDRADLFITSKTMTEGYKPTREGIERSLERAGLDHFDLMLVHWPNSDHAGTYRALEEAYQAGLLRAIGVSNFNSDQIGELCEQADVAPMIDQIETSVYWQQRKMHPFLQGRHILHESWSPLGEGRSRVLEEPALQAIADHHHKSVAQVVLRFLTQEDVIVLPRSTNPAHIRENLDIFDFTLDEAELDRVRRLDRAESVENWPSDMLQEQY
ncbi:aldo/keto reductase [Bifidobacterium xylocopae]|uniref:Oxidoreductase n=1 Tax=Bifidobacterium xylocopae TaxID=2493119 RepID=A0A366KE86_9BIFI|nr:aldo/keto reductase [Bifidobacterium xylocopae]RBP99889.1 oxidoreductase [Bifidobacterium xylocopae]